MFIVATLNEGGELAAYDAITGFTGQVRSVGFKVPERKLILQAGIGSDAWDRLFSGPRPAALHPFIAIDGGRHTAPSTPGDFLFHIRGETTDVCFELASRLVESFNGALTVVDEVHAFRYFESRDLLGFVDGTENPTGLAANFWATVGEEDPRFAGGNYVMVQKYLHDLTSWNSLSTEQQEAVIGRHKLSDKEIPDEDKAPDSHLTINTIADAAGQSLEIVRMNMPFGEVGKGEFGTYYIAYSKDPAIPEEMLQRMFVGSPVGTTDAILDFSTAVTGCLFYVPTDEFLDDPFPFVGRPEVTAATEPSELPAHSADASAGSLSIGSLKGMN